MDTKLEKLLDKDDVYTHKTSMIEVIAEGIRQRIHNIMQSEHLKQLEQSNPELFQ